MGIHGIFLGLDWSWLRIVPPVTRRPQAITISLIARQPPGVKKPPASQTSSDTIKNQVPVIDKEIKKKSDHVIYKREKNTLDHIPGPKRPETNAERVTPQNSKNSKKPIKLIKPKKSLKALTKKEKKTYTREIVQIKLTEELQIKEDPKEPFIDTSESVQQPLKNNPSEQPPIGDEQSDDGHRSSENTTRKENSTVTAAKGTHETAPALILARPLYRENPAPKYPKRARRKGYEGTVILEILVNKKGEVKDLKILESSGYPILDRAAITSVKKWLFEPGTKAGEKVTMWVRVPIRFRLR